MGKGAQSPILATDLVNVFGLSFLISSVKGQNSAWCSRKNKDLGVREAKFNLNSYYLCNPRQGILPLSSHL